MRLLIQNGYILTLNDEDSIYKMGDIFIDGSKVIAVGQGLDLEGFNPDQIVDASDKIIVPGFVNADLHASEVLTKGLYENRPQSVRPDAAYSFPSSKTVEWVRNIVMMAGLQSLEAGVTAVQDHWRFSDEFALEGTTTVLKAYEDLGIRAALALEIVSEDVNKVINTYEDVLSAYRRVVVAPSEHFIADKRFVEWLVNLPADKVFHFHFNQTKSNVVRSKEIFHGKTAIQQADQNGLFSHQTNISQAVWVTPEEIDLLAKNRVAVIHTPLTDLYTGSGVLPLHLLQEAGVPLAMGTGPFCGGNLNLRNASKMTALLQRIVQPDFNRWVSVEDTLHMVTRGSADACFSEEVSGQITMGSEADLVFYNRTGFSFSPLNNPKDQLICLETGSSVNVVMAGGKIVVKNGQVDTVDRDQVRKDFRQNLNLMQTAQEGCQKDGGSSDHYFSDVLRPMSIRRWADTQVLNSRLDMDFSKKD